MMDSILADAVVMIHVAFVLFAVLGGGLVLCRWRWAWLHAPAALWAALVELMGWTCPLTPLENSLRARGGATPYGSDFIEHYVMPILYPGTLTRRHQVWMGLVVVMINLALYAWAAYRHYPRGR